MGNLEQNIQNTEVPMDFKEAIRSGALDKRKIISMGKEPGEDVKVLKQFLASKGYLKADQIDSNFDENTKFALWIFQSSMREIAGEPDGKYGPDTHTAILIDIGGTEKKTIIKSIDSKKIITPKVIKETTKIETKRLKGEQKITQGVKKELKTIETIKTPEAVDLPAVEEIIKEGNSSPRKKVPSLNDSFSKDAPELSKEPITVINMKEIEASQLPGLQKILKLAKTEKDKKDWTEFMNLSIDERYEKYTQDVGKGYRRVDFGNSFIERYAKLENIIPLHIVTTELVKPEEKYKTVIQNGKEKQVPIKDDYFNLIQRNNLNEEFSSLFKGKIYNGLHVLNGYLLKPLKNKEPIVIVENQETITEYQEDKYNEKIIRTIYGKFIKDVRDYWVSTVIDSRHEAYSKAYTEAFTHSIFDQESQYNPNALSPTSTRAIGMVNVNTGMEIAHNNGKSPYSKYRITLEDFMPVNDKNPNFNLKTKTGSNIYTRMYHPKHNILLSMQYIADQMQSFALPYLKPLFIQKMVSAAYNAGPQRINKAFNRRVDGTNRYPKNETELINNLIILKNNGDIILKGRDLMEKAKKGEIKLTKEKIKEIQLTEEAIKDDWIELTNNKLGEIKRYMKEVQINNKKMIGILKRESMQLASLPEDIN